MLQPSDSATSVLRSSLMAAVLSSCCTGMTSLSARPRGAVSERPISRRSGVRVLPSPTGGSWSPKGGPLGQPLAGQGVARGLEAGYRIVDATHTARQWYFPPCPDGASLFRQYSVSTVLRKVWS